MKERMRHILCCIGTVGLMMTMGECLPWQIL